MLALLFGVFFGLNAISATVVVKNVVKNTEDIKRTVPKVRSEPKIYALPIDGKHTVKDGETLFAIANMYGIPYKTILELNSLVDANHVMVGQKLKIMEIKVDDIRNNVAINDKKSLSEKKKDETVVKQIEKTDTKTSVLPTDEHIVKDGDTLFAIARLYSVSPTVLATENNVDLLYHVKTGEKIKIPQNIVKLTEEKKDDTKKNDTTPAKKVVAQNTRDKINKKKIDCDLNFSWPVNSTKILYGYGDVLHNGARSDGVIIASELNKNIMASYSGEVAYVGNDIPEYGNLMIIKHTDNWMTIYGYMNSFTKKVGDKVKKSDSLGTIGQTSNTYSPSLYFSIRKIKVPYNPELCI